MKKKGKLPVDVAGADQGQFVADVVEAQGGEKERGIDREKKSKREEGTKRESCRSKQPAAALRSFPFPLFPTTPEFANPVFLSELLHFLCTKVEILKCAHFKISTLQVVCYLDLTSQTLLECLP